MKHILTMLLASAALSVTSHASTILVGFEDYPVCGDDDYNDTIALITGSVAVHSQGMFSPLTYAVVNQSGRPFWDNVSSDGPNMNIGNYVLGNGGFSGGPIFADPQYLASQSGAIVSFYFTGDASISIIGGITSGKNKLGVCPLGDCTAANTIWINSSLNYLPAGAWQLTSTNVFGLQSWCEPVDGTPNFALFESAAVPEPDAAPLAAAGVALLLLARWLRRPRSALSGRLSLPLQRSYSLSRRSPSPDELRCAALCRSQPRR